MDYWTKKDRGTTHSKKDVRGGAKKGEKVNLDFKLTFKLTSKLTSKLTFKLTFSHAHAWISCFLHRD